VTRIEINGFGRSVTVDADVPLDEAKAAALEVFDRTKDPQMARGFGVTGPVAERRDGGPTYYEPSDGDL
jgi:hypothetical protein